MAESRGAIISRLLDTVGDGSGTKTAIGKYSAGELGSTDFFIAPPAGEIFIIQRMIVSYRASKNWSSTLYGKAIDLTNGVVVTVQDDSGLLYTLTDPDHPILTNADWASYCYDFTLFAFGSGSDQAAIRWTFAKSGKSVSLTGATGDKLVVTLNDDYDDLEDHHFLVQGYRIV